MNDIPNSTEGVRKSALEELQIVTSPMARRRQIIKSRNFTAPQQIISLRRNPSSTLIMAYDSQLSFLNDEWEIFKNISKDNSFSTALDFICKFKSRACCLERRS